MTLNKKSVLISIDSFYDGGAEIFAIRLANALSKFYHVHFMELDSSKSQDKNQIKLLNFGIEIFQPEKDPLKPWADNTWFRRIYKVFKPGLNYAMWLTRRRNKRIADYIKKESIITVNTHAPESNLCMAEVKELIPFKLVTTLHGHYELYRSNMNDDDKFGSFMNAQIEALDDVIYTTNDQLATFLEFNYPKKNLTKIFYGIDLKPDTRITKFNDSSLRLILVSRGIKEKGWQQAIDAVVELQKTGYKISLLIVGDGPEYNKLKDQYDHVQNIELVGHKDNVTDYIKNAHVGILPTYYEAESLPNSIVEYLAMGKPVISTNIGAIPDMIKYKNELAGTLLEAQRGQSVNITKLKEAILKYIEQPSLVGKQSEIAIRAFNKFKMEYCVKEYKQLLN